MAGHLLGVLKSSVVLQINRDAGCPPGVTSDRGEKTREANFADRSGVWPSTLYPNAAGPESPKMLMMYTQSESASCMPSHRKLGMRPFRTQTDSGNESRKPKNPFVTYPKESRFHLEIRFPLTELAAQVEQEKVSSIMGGSKDPVQKLGAQYGIRNQEPAETNGGHLQAASPGKIPGPAGASGRIHFGV